MIAFVAVITVAVVALVVVVYQGFVRVAKEVRNLAVIHRMVYDQLHEDSRNQRPPDHRCNWCGAPMHAEDGKFCCENHKALMNHMGIIEPSTRQAPSRPPKGSALD